MVREIVNEKPVSIPEVKEILEKIIAAEKIDMKPAPAPVTTGEDGAEVVPETVEADKTKKYFLKSTYEYVQTFSWIDARVARNVVQKLVTENQLPLLVAIQIANINPNTVDELSLIMEKSQRRLSGEEIEKLLYSIRAYRELP
jgi:DNA-directed RNA polymerase subunit F